MALANLLRALVSGGDPGSGGEGDPAELAVTGQRQPAGDDPQMAPPMSSADQFLQQPNPQMDAPQAPSGTSQDATPPGLNYNNSRQAGAVQDALDGEPALRGGSANPGIYGILPKNLQHGTLRNVLGALGDAFLVGSGHDAQYRPRMENQSIGAALAGYNPEDPDSVQAAIQRVAATGAPGSQAMVEKLQASYASAQYHKAQMAQTAAYHAAQTDARIDTRLQAIVPQLGGVLSQVRTPEQYASLYDQISRRIQRIDPKATPETLGLPGRDEWTAEGVNGYGLTANNVQQSTDRGYARGTSERNADVAAGSRVEAAQIGAGSRVLGAQISAGKPTNSTMMTNLMDKQNRGEELTGSEQAYFDHATQISARNRRRPPPGAAPAPVHPAGGGGGSYPTFSPAQAAAAAKIPGNKGKKFRDSNGQLRTFH